MRLWRGVGGLFLLLLVALACSHLKQSADVTEDAISRADVLLPRGARDSQFSKATMRLRIWSDRGQSAVTSSKGRDLPAAKQRAASRQGSQQGVRSAAAHVSLSDVVKRDSKVRSSRDTPSQRLKAAGYDPDTWTQDPLKHMQRKAIPTRYDDQLEEDMYEDSELQANDEAAMKSKPQTAKQAGAMQLRGQKVDAGSVRMNELADADLALSTGDRRADRQHEIKDSKAARDADRDQDEADQHALDSDKSKTGRLGTVSESSSLDRPKSSAGSSDSREAAVPREQSAAQKAGKGSRGDENEGTGVRKSVQAGKAQDGQLDDERDATADQRLKTKHRTANGSAQGAVRDRQRSDGDGEEIDMEQDAEEARRRRRHGQRLSASGDRSAASSDGQDRDSQQAAAEGVGRRESISGSSSGSRGQAGAASETKARGSSASKSSAASGRSSAAAGDGRREGSSPKKKAAPAVRPALKGYNLTWDVLEAEQEVNSELLSDDPTRWSWQPSTPDQPGLLLDLTAELVKRSSKDNAVIVTWASSAYLDFLRNWVHYITSWDVDNILIGAMDEVAAAYLHEEGLPYFTMFGQGSRPYTDLKGTLEKGSKAARTLAFNKIGIARAITGFGVDVIMSDADVVWQRDPTDYCTSVIEADVLMATDALGPSNAPDDDGLETPSKILYSDLSTGIMYFRSSPGAQKFLSSWDATLRRSSNATEQSAFNAVVRRGMRPLKTHSTNYRVFYGMNGEATFGVLPLPGFLNGHGYFVQRLHEVMRTSPYGVHADYIFGGLIAKRNRLREAQIWLDEPSYYSSPRLLQVDLHVPAVPDNFERLRSDYMVELHLKVMQHQLDQMVAAFSLAMLLNRTLVMPKFVCFCDRGWAPLDRCRARGGGRLELPFVCPMDHIFQQAHFNDDPASFGPPLFVREHSFLENPAVPSSVLEDELELVLSKTPSLGESTAAVLVSKQLYFPQQETDLDLLKTLQPYKNVQMLTVGRVTGMMRGFATRETAEGFWRRMAHITGAWCCNYEGGFKYSMLPFVPFEDDEVDEEEDDEADELKDA